MKPPLKLFDSKSHVKLGYIPTTLAGAFCRTGACILDLRSDRNPVARLFCECIPTDPFNWSIASHNRGLRHGTFALDAVAEPCKRGTIRHASRLSVCRMAIAGPLSRFCKLLSPLHHGYYPFCSRGGRHREATEVSQVARIEASSTWADRNGILSCNRNSRKTARRNLRDTEIVVVENSLLRGLRNWVASDRTFIYGNERRASRSRRLLLSGGSSERQRGAVVSAFRANYVACKTDLRSTAGISLAARCDDQWLGAAIAAHIRGVWHLRSEGCVFGIPQIPSVYGIKPNEYRCECPEKTRTFIAENHRAVRRQTDRQAISQSGFSSSPSSIKLSPQRNSGCVGDTSVVRLRLLLWSIASGVLFSTCPGTHRSVSSSESPVSKRRNVATMSGPGFFYSSHVTQRIERRIPKRRRGWTRLRSRLASWMDRYRPDSSDRSKCNLQAVHDRVRNLKPPAKAQIGTQALSAAFSFTPQAGKDSQCQRHDAACGFTNQNRAAMNVIRFPIIRSSRKAT